MISLGDSVPHLFQVLTVGFHPGSDDLHGLDFVLWAAEYLCPSVHLVPVHTGPGGRRPWRSPTGVSLLPTLTYTKL